MHTHAHAKTKRVNKSFTQKGARAHDGFPRKDAHAHARTIEEEELKMNETTKKK